MVIFMVLLLVLGVLFIGVCLGATALIEPIIAILIIYGIYKLIKRWIS